MLKGRHFVAVDFDSRQLRLVQAERTRDGARIGSLSGVPVPDGLDTADPQAMGQFLGETLRRMRLGGASVLMSVPRTQAVLKPLQLPRGTDESEMAGMIQYQVAGELPFRVEEAVIDFTVEDHVSTEKANGENGDGVQVLVGAVRVPVVDYYRQIARAAGVNLTRLGLRPYANARCLDACVQGAPGELLALVHLTANEAEIDVVADKALVFSRSAKLKLSDATDATIARREVGEVATEVLRSLQSFTAIEGGRRVHRVLVAGATGMEEAVGKEVSLRLDLPVELLNPAPAFGIRQGQEGAGAFVTALGLALGSTYKQLPFDFLNPKRPVVKRDYRRAKIMAAAVLTLAVLLGVGIARARVLGDLEKQVRAVDAQIKQHQGQTRERTLQARRAANVQAWVDARTNWLDHLAAISAMFPPAQEAYVPQSITVQGASRDGEQTLAFVIRARDASVITEFGQRLRDLGYAYSTEGVSEETRGLPEYSHVTRFRVIIPQGTQVAVSELPFEPRRRDDAALERPYGAENQRRAPATPRPAPAAPAAPAAAPSPPTAAPTAPSPTRPTTPPTRPVYRRPSS